MCCRNSSVIIKTSEKDLETYKSDLNNKSKSDRKTLNSENETEEEKYKNIRSREVLGKINRENINKRESICRDDRTDKIVKLAEIVNSTDVLQLKVKNILFKSALVIK
jgi:hypothetical protein